MQPKFYLAASLKNNIVFLSVKKILFYNSAIDFAGSYGSATIMI